MTYRRVQKMREMRDYRCALNEANNLNSVLLWSSNLVRSSDKVNLNSTVNKFDNQKKRPLEANEIRKQLKRLSKIDIISSRVCRRSSKWTPLVSKTSSDMTVVHKIKSKNWGRWSSSTSWPTLRTWKSLKTLITQAMSIRRAKSVRMGFKNGLMKQSMRVNGITTKPMAKASFGAQMVTLMKETGEMIKQMASDTLSRRMERSDT